MNILFLIRTLNPGGAERQLVNLAKGLKNSGHEVSVALLYPVGSLKKDLDDSAVPVFFLNKKSRWDIFSFYLSLLKILRKLRPQIIHGYGVTPNILSVTLKVFYRSNIKVVFGIRSSYLDLSKYDKFVILTSRLESFLSRFSDLIITNSNAGKKHIIAHGYNSENIRTVYNGINTDVFIPNRYARVDIRDEWRIEPEVMLIGMIGRLDPMKEHAIFIEAISKVCSKKSHLMAVCIGSGSKSYLEELKQKAIDENVDNRIIWKSTRKDIAHCINAFDLFVSSSSGEGFSNVIGESMAAGIPCIVTDVGDSSHIVGECGVIISANSSQGLSDAILDVIESDKFKSGELSICSRRRIIENFSLQQLISESEKCLASLVR